MKNLIYQYWDGPVRESCRAGVANLKAYADRIGAEHLFEENPQFIRKMGLDFGNYSAHYGAFKPIFNKNFAEYDNILFCDTDIFAIENLSENIFEEIEGYDIGICREKFQETQRKITLGRITNKRDEQWSKTIKRYYGTDMPRNEAGDLKVFNSGVVLYSRDGLNKAKEKFRDFHEYVNLIRQNGFDAFYTCDQPYLHAMMFVAEMRVKELDDGWNSYIHYTHDKENPEKRIVDNRTENTKFVHIQFAGADNLDGPTHERIANLPQDQWELPKK